MTKAPFQPMTLEQAPSDHDIAQFAISRGAQQTVLKPSKRGQPVSREHVEPPPAGADSAIKSVKLEFPNYIRRALKIRAAEQEVSVRYLVLKALKADGFTVDEEDLFEDGRRFNAIRRGE